MRLDRTPAGSPWTDACLAAALFAVDPAGTGGIMLRARPGPVRDRWLALLRVLLPPQAPIRRIPLHVIDGRLLGGLDLASTLHAGRPVAERGLLAEADGGIVLLAMAERLTPMTVARLTTALDLHEIHVERDGLTLRLPTRFGIVGLDESVADDEHPSPALLDRLAVHADLAPVALRDLDTEAPSAAAVAAARSRLAAVAVTGEAIAALCAAAEALGIASVRAPLLALRVARVAAAFAGRSEVTPADLAVAGRLVLASRMTTMPTAPLPEPPPEPAPGDDAADGRPDETRPDTGAVDLDPALTQMVLAAVRSALPDGLLSQLHPTAVAARSAAAGGRAGAVRPAFGGGRPVGVRQGDPRSGARLNVIETLRAAAPWQPLRRATGREDTTRAQPPPRIEVRRDDFRVTRCQQRTATTSIFIVDASGSTAMHRLAEAKGAVELLLADCYVRRDKVALLAFRGRGVELVLPPTRSLVRAKRCLAGLPGGGATPLAAGLHAACTLAETLRRRGETPVAILLTDGSANVTLDGSADRTRATDEALGAARRVRLAGITALLVDTAPRPRPTGREIADAMGGVYLPLPYADAGTLSAAVRAETRLAQTAAGR